MFVTFERTAEASGGWGCEVRTVPFPCDFEDARFNSADKDGWCIVQSYKEASEESRLSRLKLG